MEAIKHTGYLHNPELVNSIVGKLSSAMVYNYNQYLHDNASDEPRLKILSDFLYREAEMAYKAGTNFSFDKTVKKAKDQYVHKRSKTREKRKHFTVAKTELAESSRSKRGPKRLKEIECGFCRKKKHTVIECRHFAKLSGQDRWKWAAGSRVCYRCLLGRHRYHQCKVTGCKLNPACRERHHELLHDKGKSQQKSQEKIVNASKNTTENVTAAKSSD